MNRPSDITIRQFLASEVLFIVVASSEVFSWTPRLYFNPNAAKSSENDQMGSEQSA